MINLRGINVITRTRQEKVSKLGKTEKKKEKEESALTPFQIFTMTRERALARYRAGGQVNMQGNSSGGAHVKKSHEKLYIDNLSTSENSPIEIIQRLFNL